MIVGKKKYQGKIINSKKTWKRGIGTQDKTKLKVMTEFCAPFFQRQFFQALSIGEVNAATQNGQTFSYDINAPSLKIVAEKMR